MDRERAAHLIRQVYDARCRGDVEGVLDFFADGASFSLAGSTAASPVPSTATGKAAIGVVLQRLTDSFVFDDMSLVALVVEGDRAAVRWRVRVRTPAGAEAVTELADFLEFKDGKIAAFTQFADTALAASLLGR